jgi:hypothetical protein
MSATEEEEPDFLLLFAKIAVAEEHLFRVLGFYLQKSRWLKSTCLGF